MILLYLIRHGETVWTLSGQHTGKTDLPLTANGKTEARGLAKSLMNVEFDLVYSSPLKRALETCELAGFEKGAILDPDLVEWDYGDFEGKTSAEVLKGHPNWNLFQDGCPHGESVEAITRRADHFLKKIEKKTGKIAIFSHGHILRVLIARWLGFPASEGQKFFLETSSITILGFEHIERVVISPSVIS